MNLIPVILSGGTGTRLWPLSLPHEPKQFLDLGFSSGESAFRSLIQQTLLRLQGLSYLKNKERQLAPVIVCNQEHRFLVSEQMRAIDSKPLSIILEPVGRNTAPALAVSALRALKEDKHAVLLVMPSDHLIQNKLAFHKAIEKAMPQAEKGTLMTFGILPHSPKTGYGYIKKGRLLTDDAVYKISEFVEKPNREKAEVYLASGDYFWNSGIFLFRADAFLAELKKQNPQILEACEKAFEKGREGDDYYSLDEASFADSPSDSIDYAVMENAEQAGVAAVDMGWNDVGTWQSLWEEGQKDEQGNVLQGNVCLENSRDCLVYARGNKEKKLALIGTSDLIIVDTPDALLVCHRDSEQDVKKMATNLLNNCEDKNNPIKCL